MVIWCIWSVIVAAAGTWILEGIVGEVAGAGSSDVRVTATASATSRGAANSAGASATSGFGAGNPADPF